MVLDESRPHWQEESLVEAIGSIRIGLRFLAPKPLLPHFEGQCGLLLSYRNRDGVIACLLELNQLRVEVAFLHLAIIDERHRRFAFQLDLDRDDCRST